MFKRLVVFLVALAFVIFAASYITGYVTLPQDLSGLVSNNPFGEDDLAVSLSLSTDTEVYHSGEMMEARVAVACNKDLDSAIVRLYGVKDSRKTSKINEQEIVEIKAPGDEVVFLATMPRCYGCASVSPGDHELTAEVIYGSEVISSTTKTITLVK